MVRNLAVNQADALHPWGFESLPASFFLGGFAPTALRACPPGFVGVRNPTLRVRLRGRMCFAHCIRPPPLGARGGFAPLFSWGLRADGPSAFPPGFVGGHIPPLRDGLRGRMGFAHSIRPPPPRRPLGLPPPAFWPPCLDRFMRTCSGSSMARTPGFQLGKPGSIPGRSIFH